EAGFGDAIDLGNLEHEMLQRRAELGDRDRMTAEILEGMQASRISLVRDQHADALEASALPSAGGDDLERALPREVEERRSHGGRREIAIARGDRERNRLRRAEGHDLGIEAFACEEAL